MNQASYTDQFVAVNGPEDGNLYPVMRLPSEIGSAPGGDIVVRTDRAVSRQAAQISAASGGLRVRRIGAGTLLVDGRHVGYFSSRLLRDKSVLQVGNTELWLRLSPHGLSQRSKPTFSDSDAAWALRSVTGMFKGLFSGLSVITSFFRRRWVRRIVLLAILYALLRYFFPIQVAWGWYYVVSAFQSIFS